MKLWTGQAGPEPSFWTEASEMSVLWEMEKGKKGSTGKLHHNAYKENDQRSWGLCHVRINNNNLHIYFIGRVHWRRKNKFKILYICVVAVHVFLVI